MTTLLRLTFSKNVCQICHSASSRFARALAFGGPLGYPILPIPPLKIWRFAKFLDRCYKEVISPPRIAQRRKKNLLIMIVGIKKLLKLVKEKKLVENLAERELRNPEGAGFDVRVGGVYKTEGEGFLGIDERKTPEGELVASFPEQKEYILEPNEYVLIKTIEKVNLPENLVMLNFPRSTLYRCGILFLATQTAPGYRGNLVYGLKNLGGNPFKLELGARIAHIMFYEVQGRGNKYKGQWQGGRVTTKHKEKQI